MQEDHEEKVGLVNADPAGPTQLQNPEFPTLGQPQPAPADEP